MKTYDLDTVVEIVTEIVDKYGRDYVYPGHFGDNCLYWDVDEHEPSCLVGHFLYNTDLITDPHEFSLIEKDTALNACDQVERWRKVRFTNEATDFLYAAQNRQDQGNTWGSSVDFAKDAAEAVSSGKVFDVQAAIRIEDGGRE